VEFFRKGVLACAARDDKRDIFNRIAILEIVFSGRRHARLPLFQKKYNELAKISAHNFHFTRGFYLNFPLTYDTIAPKGVFHMPARKKATEVKMETKAKRNFRSAEERIAEIDRKIAFHTRSIEQLEARKAKINAPASAACLTQGCSRN
jgi:hypothetical protein